jgi:hypothetical protein
VVHRAFAKAASLLPDRTLYYINRRLRFTVTNNFSVLCPRLGARQMLSLSQGIALQYANPKHAIKRGVISSYYFLEWPGRWTSWLVHHICLTVAAALCVHPK